MILLIALYFSLFLLHNLGDRWIEYFIDVAISFRANGVMGCGYLGGEGDPSRHSERALLGILVCLG